MKRKIFITFISLIFICSICIAHSGRTDKYGGHYNRSTGTYHYHSGQYANTGEYTAPIEEGGTKINSDFKIILNDEIVDTEEEGQDITTDYESQIEDLKSDINNKEEEITTLNRRLEEQKLENENILEEKDNEIERLNSEQTEMFIMFVIFYAISLYIAYQVGKDR